MLSVPARPRPLDNEERIGTSGMGRISGKGLADADDEVVDATNDVSA